MSSPTFSLEFFPPKSLEASFRLWDTLKVLAPMGPKFVSVTYGAGGTTRDLTHEAVETIQKGWGIPVAAHLTCVGATRGETLAVANRYREAGVKQIVALRGDAPKGEAFAPHDAGFASSEELTSALAATGDFELAVGAYPDPHPDAKGPGADVDYLKRKVDAGATSAITQFFFEADTFFRFRDACMAAGIDIPILPGILPIQSWKGAVNFAGRCGTKVPDGLAAVFEDAIAQDREAEQAAAHCADLCRDLIAGGVDHLHFYTLNKPDMTRDALHALGFAPTAPLREVA